MNFFSYLGWGLLVLLGLYVAARLISAAFYQSKKDFDKRNGS